MSDSDNMAILKQFMDYAVTGAPVWYMQHDNMVIEDGFTILEPTPSGKPWTWVSGPELVQKLLLRVPQATRVWIVPDDVAQQFLSEQGLA